MAATPDGTGPNYGNPPPSSGGGTTTKRTTSKAAPKKPSYALADARDVLAQTLVGEWGLARSALTWAYGRLKAGHSISSIVADLYQRPEFKRRFPGIEARQKAGLGTITPAEYISTERAYRQVFRNAGVPRGFYDHPNDFTAFIVNDVSPRELGTRVQNVYEEVKNALPAVRKELASYYGVSPSDGALLAYALNPKKGLDVITRQVQAAEIGAAAVGAGLTESRSRSEQLLAMGVSAGQAQQGFGAVAGELGTEARQVGATQPALTQGQLESEVFQGNQQVAGKRKRRAQEAQAVFGAGGGAAANQSGLVALGQATEA